VFVVFRNLIEVMDIEKQIKYWLSSAESDLTVSEHLFDAGDYHWCLYIAHLVIEKALKAYYCYSRNDLPPRTHDLLKLAKLSNLNMTQYQKELFLRINDFNIEARYPDQKFSFYKTATKDFTYKNLNHIKKEFSWIKSLIK
jgi:HEPN domain-containing protein